MIFCLLKATSEWPVVVCWSLSKLTKGVVSASSIVICLLKVTPDAVFWSSVVFCLFKITPDVVSRSSTMICLSLGFCLLKATPGVVWHSSREFCLLKVTPDVVSQSSTVIWLSREFCLLKATPDVVSRSSTVICLEWETRVVVVVREAVGCEGCGGEPTSQCLFYFLISKMDFYCYFLRHSKKKLSINFLVKWKQTPNLIKLLNKTVRLT